jgi:hypothetical protein
LFCPKCHAEFTPGFTRCDECDVELVDELPPERKRHAIRGLLHRLLPPERDESGVLDEPKTPLARRPLVWFFALTGAVYLVSVGFAATHQGSFGFLGPVWLNRLHSASWLVIGTVTLLCCRAISAPRDRPPRRLVQLSIAVVVTLLVVTVRSLEIWVEWFAFRVTTVQANSPVPLEVRRQLHDVPSWLQALSVGLVMAGTVSSFPFIREKVRALVAWRAAHILRLAGLALLVPAACAAGAALSVLLIAAIDGSPLTFHPLFSWVGVEFVMGALLNVPLVFAWYGFVAERLLGRLSPLFTALVVGLAWFVPYQLGWWAINARVGNWVPYDLPMALTIVSNVALAVPAVWFMRKARGSLLPTLLFLAAGTAGSGVVQWSGSSETSYVRAGEIYPTALVVVAVLFAVLGHMWQRPEAHSRLLETGDRLSPAESPG